MVLGITERFVASYTVPGVQALATASPFHTASQSSKHVAPLNLAIVALCAGHNNSSVCFRLSYVRPGLNAPLRPSRSIVGRIPCLP
jgi:hypothetical protein